MLKGTSVQDNFRIGNSVQNLYAEPVSPDAKGSIVVIKDFNPFLDTIELHLPEHSSFVWDQILYRKDPQPNSHTIVDRVLLTDEGGNERAAERFISQPILDSYGREVIHSYVLHEYKPVDSENFILLNPTLPTVYETTADSRIKVSGDNVDGGKLTAKIFYPRSGDEKGIDRIVLQWQKSIDNGVNWVDINGETSDVMDIPNNTV